MNVKNQKKNNHIHFVGIGGAGMSSIATVLYSAGYIVSGSDLVFNEITKQLVSLGITVFLKHQSQNIKGANMIIISSAIHSDNPEIIAAKKKHIPVIHRAKILAKLMQSFHSIAISGTHGKTTTTGMLASIYYESGLDPTFINGGLIKSFGVYAHLGCSRYLIAEADESDASFLNLKPISSIITNIEADHMDIYQGSLKKLKKAFLGFLHNLPFYGQSIICLDNLIIRELLPEIDRKIITYGFSQDSDLCIINYCQQMNQSSFTLRRKNKSNLFININMPGRHNALNATAAIAVASEFGINDQDIFKAMSNFRGIGRRFEELGKYNLECINGQTGEIIVVDDYGHHPEELNITIETVRVGWPDKRLVMFFQPHRFTRTRDLYNDFVKVLSKVDVLVIFNVFSAGELPIFGINSYSLCETIRKFGKIKPIFVSEDKLLYDWLFILKNNDFLLIQGAGTIRNIVHKLGIIN